MRGTAPSATIEELNEKLRDEKNQLALWRQIEHVHSSVSSPLGPREQRTLQNAKQGITRHTQSVLELESALAEKLGLQGQLPPTSVLQDNLRPDVKAMNSEPSGSSIPPPDDLPVGWPGVRDSKVAHMTDFTLYGQIDRLSGMMSGYSDDEDGMVKGSYVGPMAQPGEYVFPVVYAVPKLNANSGNPVCRSSSKMLETLSCSTRTPLSGPLLGN